MFSLKSKANKPNPGLKSSQKKDESIVAFFFLYKVKKKEIQYRF